MRKSLFVWLFGAMIAMAFSLPPAQAQSDGYGQEELDSMLAPIALYPDGLLSQILIAATYPDDVADAADFLNSHASLTGDALANAVSNEPWNDSVKSLIQFPSVIAMLNDQPDWADALGYAFVNQQADVLAAVQRLRDRAQQAGYLESNEQQRVIEQNGSIYIEPVRSNYYYVPYYDPLVVYGSWWWPNRPPVYWVPPPRYRPSGYSVANGIFFGAGVGIVASIFHPVRPDWHHHHVVVVGGRRPGHIWHYQPRPQRPGIRPTNRPVRPWPPGKPPMLKPPPHRPVVRPPSRPGRPSVRSPQSGRPAVKPGRPEQPSHPRSEAARPGVKPAPIKQMERNSGPMKQMHHPRPAAQPTIPRPQMPTRPATPTAPPAQMTRPAAPPRGEAHPAQKPARPVAGQPEKSREKDGHRRAEPH